MPEANQLLKYKPEAIPTLNSYDTMCTKDAQEYYFLFAHNQKNNDDLANTTYNYETQYSGNGSHIHNVVGDQYYTALTGMVSIAGMPNSQI